MDRSVNENAPNRTDWGYDLGNAIYAMFFGAIYLMCFDPKVGLATLPVAVGIAYNMPKSGHANTIPLRLGASVLTFLTCFLGAVLSEFLLGEGNKFQGLYQYFSSDHIAQAFGATYHDAPYRWYFCAAALAFIAAARSPSKSKISPADKMIDSSEKKDV
jgi:hypothetical protein